MNKTNSGANAQESKDGLVFITILKRDRDWINKTKGKLNRQERLHELIAKAKGLAL